MNFRRNLTILTVLSLFSAYNFAQEGFTDQTRALYILDISRYVMFDDSFQDLETFTISILGKELDLYWELERLSKTRKEIQGKPIKILVSSEVKSLKPSQVVFVNSQEKYHIKDVLKAITGSKTLLISEGYPFRSSMINFVLIDGKPKFEANEELMIAEGLYVNDLFLAQAVDVG